MIRKNLSYSIAVLLLLILTSCNEKLTDSILENRLPETFISLNPDSSISQQKSILTINWWGDDPDGLVVGYFFKWEGLDSTWNFTVNNDSTFYLPIGSNDTSYVFKVIAADNSGNGIYDHNITWNGINLGQEPFNDKNGNGNYDLGEEFIDLGGMDPTAAELKFPIKNTAPTISWSKESFLPATSFPVVSFGWNAEDIDGSSSITKIKIALNDTTDFTEIKGNIRFVTLRVADKNALNPEMQILVNGLEDNILNESLKNLKYDDFNRIYLKAEDISGAESQTIVLPDTSKTWFVKKPTSNFLLVDDFDGTKGKTFYNDLFDTFKHGEMKNNYEELDIENSNLPFASITLPKTLKLFDYIFWYSDSKPSLDLINSTAQSYLQQGGKIAFSMTFEDSSSTFMFDLSTLQGTFPVQDFGQKKPVIFLSAQANLIKSDQNSGYPNLRTASTIGFVRTYIPNDVSAFKVYDISSNQINGNIAFMDKSKSMFFIGLPLHQCDGIQGSVKTLLEKIYFDDFGFSL